MSWGRLLCALGLHRWIDVTNSIRARAEVGVAAYLNGGKLQSDPKYWDTKREGCTRCGLTR